MSAAARVAIVTGASSGIGEACARALAAAGMAVVAGGRRAERLEALARELSAAGAGCTALAGDATADDAIDALFDAGRRRFGRDADAVVLCAGRGLPGTLLGSDSSRWRELVEVNYLALARQLRRSGELLVEQSRRDGAPRARDIVVIGSTAGREVSAANPVYGSTKFAVHALVEAARRELCAHGVRTTLVEPGFVRSGFQAAAGYDPEWFAGVERDCGPLLEPADVARTVAFVVAQPPHVHVDDVRIRPTRQRV